MKMFLSINCLIKLELQLIFFFKSSIEIKSFKFKFKNWRNSSDCFGDLFKLSLVSEMLSSSE